MTLSIDRSRCIRVGALSVLLGVGLVGCGGGDSTSTSGGAVADIATQVGGAPSGGVPNGGAPNGAAQDKAAEGAASGLPAGLPAPDLVGSDRQIVRTADIMVRSSDVNADATRAKQQAVDAGGEITADNRSGTGDSRTADLVLQVPPDRLDTVLDSLSALGDELSRSSSSQDVTAVVADVDSRVSSQEASLARLRDLISRAVTITDLVNLESQLATREADLESLQAQQRALAGEVALATVSVHLVTRDIPAPTKGTGGFLTGLGTGWDAFVTAGALLLTLLGTLLPFAVTVAVLVGIALALRRRRRPAPVPADAAVS